MINQVRKKRRLEASSNLRYLSIDTLLKIRSNDYKSQFYKGHLYDKDLVEAEIERKINSKKFKGF